MKRVQYKTIHRHELHCLCRDHMVTTCEWIGDELLAPAVQLRGNGELP